MAPLKKIIVFFSFIIAAGAPVAQAQNPTVLIYDSQRVLREAVAVQDIDAKVQTIGEAMNRELEPASKALETERKSLAARAANRPQEELAQDAALRSQIEAFNRKDRAQQEKQQIRSQELSVTRNQAIQEFGLELNNVLAALLTDKGANIILDASAVTAFVPAVDITDDVLAKLNNQMPSVSVTRRVFTDEEKQQFLESVREQQQRATAQLVQQQLVEQQVLSQVAQQQRLAQQQGQ